MIAKDPPLLCFLIQNAVSSCCGAPGAEAGEFCLPGSGIAADSADIVTAAGTTAKTTQELSKITCHIITYHDSYTLFYIIFQFSIVTICVMIFTHCAC